MSDEIGDEGDDSGCDFGECFQSTCSGVMIMIILMMITGITYNHDDDESDVDDHHGVQV